MQPVLIEKMFTEDGMEMLNLDNVSGVSIKLLRTIHKRLDLEKFTSLSLVGNTAISSQAMASFLRGCVNLSYLNLKSCVGLKNDTFPEELVKQLPQLSYLNISFTLISGKGISTIYTNCKKLATLKLAGCNLLEGSSISKVFPHPSDTLISLKIRHCAINSAELQYILEQFPNLENFDCSSSPGSGILSIRPFTTISHTSQLRKLNISNLPKIDLTKPVYLKIFFTIHTKIEHIYLTDSRVNLESVIPDSSLANFKTIFFPGISNSTAILPAILKIAQNLTYLDLSRTYLRFDPDDYSDPLVFNVPHLRTLSLEQTGVTDRSADLISQIHTLHSLFLRNTAISSIGVRVIVYACPWLQEVDLSSCRSIPVRDRRTLLETFRREFWEHLAEAREMGTVLEKDSEEWYTIERFQNEEEDRDGLMRVFAIDNI